MPPWLTDYLQGFGPVGVFAIVFGYFVLLPIARLHYGLRQELRAERAGRPSAETNGGGNGGLLATRDMIRDTDARTGRIERNTEQEIDHLSTLVGATARLAEVMERIEKRQIDHDRWERERETRADAAVGRKRR